MTTSLYDLLDVQDGHSSGPIHERIATIFEVVRGHSSVLAEFRRRPGRWLLWIDLDEHRYRDLGEKSGRYVQFAFIEDGTSVIGECADNRFLDERCKLDDEQLDALRALGWQEPDEVHTPNWHIEVRTDDDLEALGAITGKTLLDVFGADLRDRCMIRFQERILGLDSP